MRLNKPRNGRISPRQSQLSFVHASIQPINRKSFGLLVPANRIIAQQPYCGLLWLRVQQPQVVDLLLVEVICGVKMRTVSPMVVTKSRNPVTVFVTKLVFPELANFLSQSKRMLEDVSDSTGNFGSPEMEVTVSVEGSSVVSTEKIWLLRGSEFGNILKLALAHQIARILNVASNILH